jgi:hypothetical protein
VTARPTTRSADTGDPAKPCKPTLIGYDVPKLVTDDRSS